VELVLQMLEHPPEGEVEIVEHKGIGHPDTMCDGLAECFGAALARYYQEHFGTVLHYNVDKALLVGGASRPAFGGGEVVTPMRAVLGGRASRRAGEVEVPVEEIARDAGRRWVREHMHALDPERHIVWDCVALDGSNELVDLFGRSVPLSNDTSFGVGVAPATRLERAVLAAGDLLRGMSRQHRELGEDVKVMGVRHGHRAHLTVACALIGAHLANLEAYVERCRTIRHAVAGVAAEALGEEPLVDVNAADDLASGRVYLTVTGTSAEAGDDGQVGRGNRVNGLITPYRPMSLEATAGKNPVSHVGKLYNVAATRIAQAIVERIDAVVAAECFLLSRIGHPVTDPALADVRLHLRADASLGHVRSDVEEIVRAHVESIAVVSREILAGQVRLF
jgi:S-adenosylmethionine synthetase